MEGERRQYPRLVFPLEARYLIAANERWEEASTHDLSAGGIGLLVARPSEEVAAIERVRFRLAPDEPEIELGGQTVYCNPDPDADGRQIVGVEFIDPPREVAERVRRFVFEQLLERGGAPLEGDADGPERVEWSEPVQIRYERFTQFVDEATSNLSLTGMFIQSDAPYPAGSMFEFRFQLNDDFPLIYGKAEVVWIRQNSERPELPNGMGVRFVDLSNESRELIVRIVRQKAQNGVEPEGSADPSSAPTPQESAAPAAEPKPASAPGPTQPPSSPSASKVRSQLQQLREKAKQKDEEYKKQLEKAAQALAALRVRVGELEGETESLRHDRTAEQSVFEEQIQSIAENRDQLRDQISEQQKLRGELEAELGELRTRSEETAQKERETATDRAAIEGRLADERLRAAELEAEIDELRTRCEETTQKERETAADRAAIEGRLTDERLRTAELEAELRGVREKLVTAARSAPSTVRAEEFAAIEAHGLQLKQQVEELQRSLSASETARKQIKAANQEAYAKERAARKDVKRVEQERDEMRRERDEALAGRGEATARNDSATVDSARVSELEEEQKVLLQKLMVITRRADELETELEQTESHRQRSDREQADMNGAAKALDQRLREAIRQKDELEERLGREIEELKASRAAAEASVPAADATESELHAALTAARQEAEQAREESARQVATQQREIDELRSSLSTSETARRQMATRSNDATAQEKLLRQQMAQLREEQKSAAETAEESAAHLRDTAARLSAQEIELEASIAERSAIEEQLSHAQGAIGDTDRRTRGWPLRAAALVVAGALTGLFTGPFLTGTADEEVAGTTHTSRPAAAAETAPTESIDRASAAERAAESEVAAAAHVAPPAEVAAVAAPAAEPTETQPTEFRPPAEPSPVEIEETIQRWAAAWSAQRVSEYLAFYADGFTPPNAMSRGEWAAQRKDRIERPDWIRLSVAQVEPSIVDTNRGRVVFVQSYETPTYRDEVKKTLELVLEDSTWKIVEESSS